jgi:hypothetical protein
MSPVRLLAATAIDDVERDAVAEVVAVWTEALLVEREVLPQPLMERIAIPAASAAQPRCDRA